MSSKASSSFHPLTTGLAAFLLLILIYYTVSAPGPSSEPASLHYVGESAGRMVDRHLTFYAGYDAVGTWERALHRTLFGDRHAVEDQAVDVYQEVLRFFEENPDQASSWGVLNTHARLLVTLAETGRWDALEKALNALDDSPEEITVAEAVRYAYGLEGDDVPIMEVLYGARLLPLGWASDYLRLRIAERQGNIAAANKIEQRISAHGDDMRRDLVHVTLSVGLVFLLGVLAIVWARVLQRPSPWGDGVMASSWPAKDGFAVMVRAVVLGVIIAMALSLGHDHYLRPNMLSLWSTLFAAVPMLWLMHQYLLKPRGLNLISGFGLSLRGVSVFHFFAIVFALLAIEWGGSMLISWTAWTLGFEGHWSEGLNERSIFGPWRTTMLSAVNTVAWAAIIEEIAFRGLLFVTLRSVMRAGPAIVVSALMFSALHFYSLPGFLSVFWSGLVLAYAFERFRSLLPVMIVHGAGNLLSLSTVLLFYR